MLEKLKKEVYDANLKLVEYKLVLFTWGNVSAIDRESGLIVIKPSGLEYKNMQPEDMVVVNLDGKIVEGGLNPSSDTPTHLYLYHHFKNLSAVVHTHSTYAAAFAQSGRAIPFYGTTHADYFYGDIPCARPLTKTEVETDYEKNTGKVIAEVFSDKDPISIPGVLVQSHGVFTFGKNAEQAVHNAAVLEEVAKMALLTEQLNSNVLPADSFLLEKHYNRKHGKDAYYGQKKT